MKQALRIFYNAIALLFTIAVCILAYFAVHSLLKGVPSKSAVEVDFNTILSVLLTTITIFFTVCAIVLAVLGIFGWRNLKRDAGRFAEAQALAEIARAFGPEGKGTSRIAQEMQSEHGHHRQFVEKRIRAEVLSFLPLFIERINDEAKSLALDEPTDEGDVD
jgi:heme/copper-type cytochrome/quinol oxidase subunit 2